VSEPDSSVGNTTEIVQRAGLRRGRAITTGLLVLVAGVAILAALFLNSARLDALARASSAETSLKTSMDTVASITAQRDELRGKAERFERENAELLALKEKLAADVSARDEELKKINAARAELEEKMKAEISAGDLRLTDDAGRLRVDLVDKVLFDSGDATISKRGEEVLTRVGSVLAGIEGKLIQVSGHTDDSPPTAKIQDRFPTNWELSTARATNVVRFLQEKAGVGGKRLVATGFGQNRPVASNANGGGRAKNRRIEILLVPDIEAVQVDAKAR
jgi:chemotaxis protein MotB